jgi:hypothetical protein
MTRRTNARIAGLTFLLYIAVAFPSMVLSGKATAGASVAAQLVNIAQHTTEMRITILLEILSGFCGLVLAVTLYAITRDEDRDVAMLGFACRLAEGLAGVFPVTTLGLLWLATNAGPSAPDAPSANALAAYLLKAGAWQTISASLFFAVGSTAFAFLLMRGRMIPAPIAWVGVFGSGLLVVILPLQQAGFITGVITQVAWIPVALFELTLAPWLLIKGVAAPTRTQSS